MKPMSTFAILENYITKGDQRIYSMFTNDAIMYVMGTGIG